MPEAHLLDRPKLSGSTRMGVKEFAAELDARLLRRSAAPIAGEVLAELFRFTFDPSPHARALLHVLQKHLLERTVDHARQRTAFYAGEEYSAWVPTAPGDPPDLSAFPLVERPKILERFDDFIDRGLTFGSVCHTSGSTGPSLDIYKSTEELAFLWRYYQQILEPATRALPSVPLVLFFPNLYHGVAVRLPSIGKVFASGVTDDLLIADAVKVLERRYNLPGHDARISILSGLTFQTKLFTGFLLEQGRDLRSFGIRSINAVGDYLTAHTKRFLGEAWGAMLLERFTLTESVGGANRCLRCGLFHLDPHVIGEVVDADDGRSLEEGIGHLVLTQLHPFVQMQPLIRYPTGDLVRRVRSDCSNTMSFQFLGKTVNCVRWRPETRSEWLLFSADLHEIIDAIPDIRRFEEFANLRVVRDRGIGGPSIFNQATSPEHARPFHIQLTFELRYAPHYHPERLRELRDLVTRGLRAAATPLARRLDADEVTLAIDFVGPGALGDKFKLKI